MNPLIAPFLLYNPFVAVDWILTPSLLLTVFAGNPKGVCLTHCNVVSMVSAVLKQIVSSYFLSCCVLGGLHTKAEAINQPA